MVPLAPVLTLGI